MKPLVVSLTMVVAWALSVSHAAMGDDAALRPVHQVLDEKPADLMLHYFQGLAENLPENHTAPQSLEEWKRRRVQLRKRLWQSLGSFPLEDRPPLNSTVTGRIDHGDHVVEKILYESLPGLYVTALAYVPKKIEKNGSAVICVNGHWAEAKTTKIIQRRYRGPGTDGSYCVLSGRRIWHRRAAGV